MTTTRPSSVSRPPFARPLISVSPKPMCQRPAEQPEAEGEPAHHVSPEEATRLVQKAVKPLEPEALQEGRCTRLVSCQEAERDPDAGEPRPRELGPEGPDQPLLLR